MDTATVRRKVERDVRDLVREIFALDFFTAVKKGQYTRNQLIIFAEQYYYASKFFPRMLALAVSVMPTDRLRTGLVSNLWDEHGRGDLKLSHRELLKKFVFAAGSKKKDLDEIAPISSTLAYIMGMCSLCSSDNVLVVLGGMGPGCEAFTPAEYAFLIDALSKKYKFSRNELEFFIDHAKHDGGHMDDLYTAMTASIESRPNGLQDVVLGARVAIEFEKLFWRGLHREMIASR
ncbi:MAG TPA: iron-containing redox enzyme family protein [Reyranella sp.]|nr:iron-containing redox enzyme family protein [Reyranella sp.]